MTATLAAAVAGLGTGLGLIVAIGAQNAFVLRQGLLQRHVGPVVAFCIASDVALLAAGTAGVGALSERLPVLLEVLRWGGVAFLLGYGLLAARRAWLGESLETAGAAAPSLGAALATVAAFTWLNPHVYLDTVVLAGSLAASHGDLRWWFAGGAMIGSLLWFLALGYGARLLAPVFAKPLAWRVLDGAVAVVMVLLAVSLLRG